MIDRAERIIQEGQFVGWNSERMQSQQFEGLPQPVRFEANIRCLYNTPSTGIQTIDEPGFVDITITPEPLLRDLDIEVTESTPGWTGSIFLESTNVQKNSNSIKLQDVSSSFGILATWQGTAIDISEFRQADNTLGSAQLEFWLYIDDINYHRLRSVEFGNDNCGSCPPGAQVNWGPSNPIWNSITQQNGWNYIVLPFNQATYVNTAGLDWTLVDHIQFYNQITSASSHYFLIDGMRITRGGIPPPSSSQTCGNNIKEGTELCDGTGLGGNDCTTIGQGFTGGTLQCSLTCDAWDTSQCTSAPQYANFRTNNLLYPSSAVVAYRGVCDTTSNLAPFGNGAGSCLASTSPTCPTISGLTLRIGGSAGGIIPGGQSTVSQNSGCLYTIDVNPQGIRIYWKTIAEQLPCGAIGNWFYREYTFDPNFGFSISTTPQSEDSSKENIC